tara:strand:+ start:311 stop:580 length:270 start_codon:yes stop_codon:yes gene_type:complete
MQLMNNAERLWMRSLVLLAVRLSSIFSLMAMQIFIIVAGITNREVLRGMRNNALATGSVSSLKNFYEIKLAEVTASQRSARNTFKPITE